MSADLHPTAKQLCAVHGISRRMYFHALKVRRKGCDELNRAVMDGRVSMNLALSLLEFDLASQRLILAELPDLPKRKWLGFIELVRSIASAEAKEAAC